MISCSLTGFPETGLVPIKLNPHRVECSSSRDVHSAFSRTESVSTFSGATGQFEGYIASQSLLLRRRRKYKPNRELHGLELVVILFICSFMFRLKEFSSREGC